MRVFCFPVGIGLPNLAVGILSNLSAIWEHDIFLAICELYSFHTIFLNSLDRAIRENAFFLSVCKDTLYSAIREAKEYE